MKAALSIKAATLAVTLLVASVADAQSLPVAKTNSTKVYMHYMPWFQTPASLGGTGGGNWGFHWKMNTQNPNIIDASGKRQIASHYYPMIGPYDSTDPDVLEYHMLLMKYSGVDGVLVDWYGVQGTNGDVNSLLTASNAIVNTTNNYGLGAGVVLEDRFAGNVASGQALANEQANMRYLKDNYFNKPNYIKAGAGNSPILPIFGPITIESQSLWSQILPETGTDPAFMPLEYQSNDAGTNADGEYAWPYQTANTTDHLSQVTSFYASRAATLKNTGKIVGGLAYPGFNDFYAPGGAGSTLFYIPENNGQTLTDLLNLYTTYQSRLDFLQLGTFNDYGEGTMFEPTVEDGFRSLHQIQLYAGVSYGTDELQLIYELYLARKKYVGHVATESMLDQVAADLDMLDVNGAKLLLSQASPPGDYNGDGIVDVNDYNVWTSTFGLSRIIHGSGADGNFDGVVNAADFTIWRDSLSAAGSGSGSQSVPEPTNLAICVLAAAILGCWRPWRGFQPR
jgi:Glycosyl hydrolase family 99